MATQQKPGRLARFAPGLFTLRHYERRWLRGDLIAGLAVAAYLIPQVMAYAELAGLPAIRGLWAAVGPLLVYALLGTSRYLSAGPESTTALMAATALGALTVGHPERYADAAAALAIATGLICLVGRLARLGYLAELLSTPVLTGYMLGIAVLMVVSQLGKMTGLEIEGESVAAELWFVLTHLGQVQPAPLVMSLVVVGLLIAGRTWLPRVPATLVVMVAAAVVTGLIGAERLGVGVVGAVPRGLPAPVLPDLRGVDLLAVVTAGLGITVVAFTDTVLTGRAFAGRDDHVQAGQELTALGGANLAAGLLQGFPISSSGSRTAIGKATGGHSQLTSLVAAAAVVLTLVALGPLLGTFPQAALGGVVVYAATRLVDVAGLRRLAKFRVSELVLALLTAVAVLIFGVLNGIAIAVGLSILDLLRRIARPHDAVLGFIPGIAGMHDIDDYPNSSQVPGLLIYRYDSPLFFANATNFRERALESVAEAEHPVRWFVLNAEANSEIDSTAADELEELRSTLAERGIVFGVARVRFEVRESMQAAGLVAAVGPDMFFETLPFAVQGYERWAAEHPVTDPT